MSTSKNETLSVITLGPDRTVELGRRLGGVLAGGDVIALRGELGAGKTRLARGIAYGCGVPRGADIASPTFILMNEYKGRFPVYHFDAYRLGGADELIALDSDEYFEGGGVCMVEWADRVEGSLPQDRLDVDVLHVSPEKRRFDFAATGPRSGEIIGKLSRLILKP